MMSSMGAEKKQTEQAVTIDVNQEPRFSHALLERSISKPELEIADGSNKHITVQQ
jgi:hypothetical protein